MSGSTKRNGLRPGSSFCWWCRCCFSCYLSLLWPLSLQTYSFWFLPSLLLSLSRLSGIVQFSHRSGQSSSSTLNTCSDRGKQTRTYLDSHSVSGQETKTVRLCVWRPPSSLIGQELFDQEQPPASQLSMRQVALWTHDFDSLEYRQSKNIQENQSPQFSANRLSLIENNKCAKTLNIKILYTVYVCICTLYPYLPYRVSCWRCTSACVHAWHSTENRKPAERLLLVPQSHERFRASQQSRASTVQTRSPSQFLALPVFCRKDAISLHHPYMHAQRINGRQQTEKNTW